MGELMHRWTLARETAQTERLAARRQPFETLAQRNAAVVAWAARICVAGEAELEEEAAIFPVYVDGEPREGFTQAETWTSPFIAVGRFKPTDPFTVARLKTSIVDTYTDDQMQPVRKVWSGIKFYHTAKPSSAFPVGVAARKKPRRVVEKAKAYPVYTARQFGVRPYGASQPIEVDAIQGGAIIDFADENLTGRRFSPLANGRMSRTAETISEEMDRLEAFQARIQSGIESHAVNIPLFNYLRQTHEFAAQQ